MKPEWDEKKKTRTRRKNDRLLGRNKKTKPSNDI